MTAKSQCFQHMLSQLIDRASYTDKNTRIEELSWKRISFYELDPARISVAFRGHEMSDCDTRKENISADGHARPRWLDIILFMRIVAVISSWLALQICKIILIFSRRTFILNFW